MTRGVVLLLLASVGSVKGITWAEDKPCEDACANVLISGAGPCLQCVYKHIDEAPLPASYVRGILDPFVNPSVTLTNSWCNKVDLDKYPTGWIPQSDGTYTGCEETKEQPWATRYNTHEFVKKHLKQVPKWQNEGKIWRGNEFGRNILNTELYTAVEPATNGLGITPKQHRAVRPLLDAIFGKCGCKCKKSLKESARRLLASKEITLEGDLTKWVINELVKIVFPNEDQEWRDMIVPKLMVAQAKFRATLIFPQAVPKYIAERMFASAAKDWKELFDILQPLVEEYFGPALNQKDCSPTKSCVVQMSAGLIEAFVAAGGLSVPFALKNAIWVLHADKSAYGDIFPENYRLNNRHPGPFFYEVMRLLSPVNSFAYWEPRPRDGSLYEDGFRHILSLGGAQKDPNVWGPDGHKFRVRPRAMYAKNFLGFADAAVDYKVAGGAMNRNCPAKDLALSFGAAFLSLWRQEHWEVKKGETIPPLRFFGPYVFASFTMTRKDKHQATNNDRDFE